MRLVHQPSRHEKAEFLLAQHPAMAAAVSSILPYRLPDYWHGSPRPPNNSVAYGNYGHLKHATASMMAMS